ncbi:MAG TPA: PilN domain-containing protein [Candidatus Saccharimonadales bacterium]|nr:PilN domain-containing protein [Candidatus Saccharimonadales bacterium]
MIQLNLLPDVKKEYLKSQRMKRNIITLSILASIVAGALVLLLALYVHGAQRLARNQLQNDINKSSTELSGLSDINKILTVQDALATLPSLHQQKYINSHLFDYLKVLVPNDVSLTKVDLAHTAGNTIKINGFSTDYKSLNVFVDTFKNAQLAYGSADHRTTISPFKDVTINSAGKSSDPQKPGIEFIVTVKFDPLIFDAKSENPVMQVPAVTTGQGFIKTNNLFNGSAESSTQPQGSAK